MHAGAAVAGTGTGPGTGAGAVGWPWIDRHPAGHAQADLPLRAAHYVLPSMPTTANVQAFTLDIPAHDHSFHEWNTFRNLRSKTERRRIDVSEKKRRLAAEAYHDFATALMEHCDRPQRFAEAQLCLAHDYLISRTLSSPHEDVIPALRRLCKCCEEQHNWTLAVQFIEQNITEAAHTGDPEEKQGAYVALGLVLQHWLDDLGSEQFDVYGMAEREELTNRIVSVYRRALELAEALRPTKGRRSTRVLTQDTISEIRRNANINMANAWQMRIALLAQKQLYQQRMSELQADLHEAGSAPFATDASLRCITFQCFDLSCACEVRNADALPAGISELYKKAQVHLKRAQDLCFSEDATHEDEQAPALTATTLEIDEDAPMPDGVEVQALSKVLHTHGLVKESIGEHGAALHLYLLSVRRLNCFKRLAQLNRDLWDVMVTGQSESLQTALLLCLRTSQHTEAVRLAHQLVLLAKRSVEREQRDDTGRSEELEEVYEVQQTRLIAVRTRRTLHRQLAATDTALHACEKRVPNSLEHSTLLQRRRDLLVQSIAAAEEVDDEGSKAYLTQCMLNAERRMWTALRVQRGSIDRSTQAEAWRSSLQREVHLLISIAQSVSSLAAHLFAASPAKDMERQVVDKYWRMVRLFFAPASAAAPALTLLGLPAAPHWDGFTLSELASCLLDLRADARLVVRLREEALALWDSCAASNPAVFESLLQSRVELLEEISTMRTEFALARPGDTHAAERKLECANKLVQLKQEWTQLEREAQRGSDDAKRIIDTNKAMQQQYEGREVTQIELDAANEHADEDEDMLPAAAAAPAVRPILADAPVRPKPTIKPRSRPVPVAARPAGAGARSPAAEVSLASSSHRGASSAVAAGSFEVSRKRRRIRVDGSQSPDEEDEERGLIDVSDLEPAHRAATATPPPLPSAASRAPSLAHFVAAPPSVRAASPLHPAARVLAPRSASPGVAAMGMDPPVLSPPVMARAPVLPQPESPPVPNVIFMQPSESLFTGVHSIVGQWREELVVALRRLRKDDGRGVALAVQRCNFSLAAWEELELLLNMRTSPIGTIAMAPLSNVQSVDLSMSEVDDCGWSHLLIALPQLPRLQLLDLSYTSLGHWCLLHMKYCISQSSMLRVLRLDGCSDLTGFGAQHDESEQLAEALTCNPHLQELSLRGCGLTPLAVAEVLRQLWERVPQLHMLDLSYTRSMCFRMSEGLHRALSTDVPNTADEGPFTSADDALTTWRAGMSTHILLGPADMHLFSGVYAHLLYWFSLPHGARPVTLCLDGWSCGVGLVATLVQAVAADTARVGSLHLRDSDLTEAQAIHLTHALHQHQHQPTKLTTLFYSPFPAPANAGGGVWTTLERGVPPGVALRLA